jgi:hypothetical protein
MGTMVSVGGSRPGCSLPPMYMLAAAPASDRMKADQLGCQWLDGSVDCRGYDLHRDFLTFVRLSFARFRCQMSNRIVSTFGTILSVIVTVQDTMDLEHNFII